MAPRFPSSGPDGVLRVGDTRASAHGREHAHLHRRGRVGYPCLPLVARRTCQGDRADRPRHGRARRPLSATRRGPDRGRLRRVRQRPPRPWPHGRLTRQLRRPGVRRLERIGQRPRRTQRDRASRAPRNPARGPRPQHGVLRPATAPPRARRRTRRRCPLGHDRGRRGGAELRGHRGCRPRAR